MMLLALEFPALFSLLDCWNRNPAEFAGGADDRRAWLRLLWLAVATAWLFVGYAIVLSYFYSVVRRQTWHGRD